MKKDRIIYLTSKAKKTLKEEGIKSLINKTYNFTKIRMKHQKFSSYQDILFINGCTLPHPERYRVDHQIEQLNAFGITTHKVYYENLTMDMLKYYRGFIFFRCPITKTIEKFIDKAHYFNKKVFFDIDDLVISKKYTDKIQFVKEMLPEDKKIYDDGVIRMEKTMKKCDYIITTTDGLAKELSQYGKEILINRNTVSERMVELSIDALKTIEKNPDEINIGYLSGSITHNPDFELIKPALLRIMREYENVKLYVIGILDIPSEFNEFREHIIVEKFMDWQKLPQIIAQLNINLAPIENTIFNNAKSENKWTEAALCKVPTIASNTGAFKFAIENEKTGLLCDDENDWYIKIKELIENPQKRESIGQNAYNKVIDKYVTTYSGLNIAKFIESKLVKNFGFVLPTTNISGGVNVVIKHCNILRNHGYDVSIINMDNNDENIVNNDGEINVISSIKSNIFSRFDTLIATLWATLFFVKDYPQVYNKLYLVQNFETDFAKFGNGMRLSANSTYYSMNDIKYLTISKWCENWLLKRYEKKSTYAPNGIKLENFSFKRRKFSHNQKIKILIEGNSDDYYKNVDESFLIANNLPKEKYEIQFLSYQGEPKEWYLVDEFYHKVPYDEVGKIYQKADILIKSSILESFSYPPLEMMATGGLCVVAPNGGNIEYLKDNENCLFYKPGDIKDAVSKIEKLVNDEDLRNKLIENGRKTAEERDWKNIEQKIIDLYVRK